MIELGQLEQAYRGFEKRQSRVVVVSLEDLEAARLTQRDFPHLVVLSDAERQLADAVEVIHRQSAPDGGDTTAPTTILIDGDGIVRWTFRPDRFLVRLAPEQVFAALDAHVPKR